MLERLTINLSENEIRDPRAQVRFIVRRELERLGFLQADPAPVIDPPIQDKKPVAA